MNPPWECYCGTANSGVYCKCCGAAMLGYENIANPSPPPPSQPPIQDAVLVETSAYIGETAKRMSNAVEAIGSARTPKQTTPWLGATIEVKGVAVTMFGIPPVATDWYAATVVRKMPNPDLPGDMFVAVVWVAIHDNNSLVWTKVEMALAIVRDYEQEGAWRWPEGGPIKS